MDKEYDNDNVECSKKKIKAIIISKSHTAKSLQNSTQGMKLNSQLNWLSGKTSQSLHQIVNLMLPI